MFILFNVYCIHGRTWFYNTPQNQTSCQSAKLVLFLFDYVQNTMKNTRGQPGGWVRQPR